MNRRQALFGLCGLAIAGCGARAFAETGGDAVRIGMTPVFLDDQVGFLGAWRDYLAQALGRPVEFIQRGSYREIVELMRQEKLHFAWLCGYPYVREQRWMRLLAVPVHQGQPLYRSYLIVPERDTATTKITELRDRVFAFSDPDSNSGYLYPHYQLNRANTSPANFFRRTFFTYAHKKVVEAVALEVAHGGAVDGYVWDTLARTHPELTGRTRVADRSPTFGFPPFVAGPVAPPALFRRMQEILLAMHDDGVGAGFLRQLNLDRFALGTPALYADIERMLRAISQPNA
ncbi:PhnD/SsuA/transferrin family substrate-binding protein [Aromatoleum toluolicum]|uniref:PhnD/SsuA/transferrin family substrate-binding protein n=1 Tax=Aromatoleum toluolicum TaxID=90060 RepID=A0ABX1NAK4_9RHOO|nr:PhnD/SsuA/transferrin family substrate-binding protein [Aromatoleum toluolicum]NMF96321.1 PhnD/SsuA/transferrin family substrate-binding protein [Aromatoleum toluolicum]